MEISIVMLDGTSHTLRVNPQDTVGSLKTLIYEKLGVSPQRQRLVFVNGQKMPLSDDSKFLSQYGLQSGSQVSLLVTQPPVSIQVLLRNEKGKVSTYEIKPDETVENFKRKVECRERVPVSQQRLRHQDKEMVTGKLADYNVVEMSTINLLLRLRGG